MMIKPTLRGDDGRLHLAAAHVVAVFPDWEGIYTRIEMVNGEHWLVKESVDEAAAMIRAALAPAASPAPPVAGQIKIGDRTLDEWRDFAENTPAISIAIRRGDLQDLLAQIDRLKRGAP